MSRNIKNVIPYDNRTVDWSNDVGTALSEINDFHNYWSNITSSVRLYGGIIQDNGDGTVRVGPGGGLYKIEAGSIEGVPAGECEPMGLNTAQGGKIFFSTWDYNGNVELTNNAYNYIFIVWDHTIDNEILGGPGATNIFGNRYGNTKIEASTNFYMADWENDPEYYTFKNTHPELNLPSRRSAMLHAHTVGRVYKMDNEITIRVCGTNAWNFNKRVQLFGEEFFPVIRARGLDLEPIAGTLKFNVTEGVMWAEMANRFTVREFNMSLGDTFTYWYQHSAIEKTETLAQLETNYPHGVIGHPYGIVYSSTDNKYYRFDKDWYFQGGGSFNETYGLVLASGVVSSAKEYFILQPNQEYTITLNNVYSAANKAKGKLEFYNMSTGVYTTAADEYIGEYTNGTRTYTFTTPSGGTESIVFVTLYADATTTANTYVGGFTITTDLGSGPIEVYTKVDAVTNTWSEVTDYVDSKLIYQTTYATHTELTVAHPDGYFNMSENDPLNPGKKKDYVLLQLQATDAYYKFNQTTRIWEYYGPKSTIISSEITTVAFIGSTDQMNEQWPDGYTGKVNVIIQTQDNLYYEYSGVIGVGEWIRVHGYVERNGWLRFYKQDGVDPKRYNNTDLNTLRDIPIGYYGVAWIYMCHDNSCHVVYGQDYYTNEEAKQAALPTPLPGLLAAYSTLVGKMTFYSGGTAFENAESPFLEKFISSGVSLHNDLAGLDGGSSSQNKYYHLDEPNFNNVMGASTASQSFNVTNGTASTSKTTGAIVVSGGVGISGELYVGSDITAWASSDSRLKTNVQVINQSLDKISKIGGYTFEWNEKALEIFPERAVQDTGVIAQEIQEVIPEAVVERENGYLAVQYDKIIPLLIESIKALKAEIEELKK